METILLSLIAGAIVVNIINETAAKDSSEFFGTTAIIIGGVVVSAGVLWGIAFGLNSFLVSLGLSV